ALHGVEITGKKAGIWASSSLSIAWNDAVGEAAADLGLFFPVVSTWCNFGRVGRVGRVDRVGRVGRIGRPRPPRAYSRDRQG
ncbi:MAG: hypothetical protein ACRDGV_09155, partial [Candidatus Limnocylindria bacterium]